MGKIRKYKTARLVQLAQSFTEASDTIPFKDRFNFDLMRAVLEYAAEESRRFNMNVWHACWLVAGLPENYPMPPCNTVTCLAGTSVYLSALYPKAMVRTFRGISGPTYFRAARELFKLTGDEARRLFLPEEWPSEFMTVDQSVWQLRDKDGKIIPPGSLQYVNRTIERVQMFINTEGRV